jgi:hypothetical protein
MKGSSAMATAERTERLTTAPGSGFRCDGCRQPITREQVECRCGDARLHQWCHYARSLRTKVSVDTIV